jgi:hypothetical protein
MATDRHALHGGGSNTTYGVDGRVRFNDTYAFNAQVLGSYTEEPNDPPCRPTRFDCLRRQKQYDSFFNGESFGGAAMEATATRSGRHLNIDLWYNDYSPTFRAETGSSRNDCMATSGAAVAVLRMAMANESSRHVARSTTTTGVQGPWLA